MGEFIPNQGRQVQYVPIAGGLSLVTPGKVRIAGSSPYQQFGSPGQNITFSSQRKLVQPQQQPYSPGFQAYNPLIKHLPVETERVGTINQSYINQSQNNQLGDSRKAPKTSNNGSFQNNQMPPKPEFFTPNTNQQQTLTGELQKYYGAPLVPAISSSSSSLVQQQYFPGQEQQYPQQLQKSQQKQIQKVHVNLNDSLSSSKKVLSSSEVILGTYATPVRKINNEPLSLQQVQAKLREGSKERDQPVIPTDKCKVFGEEFLEQRERDFLRRIENLEMQKNLLASQLKHKEEESSTLLEQIAGIKDEKNQRELQLVEEIEKLNNVVENLTAQNKQLRQFQAGNHEGGKIAQQEQNNSNQYQYGRQLQQTYQQVLHQ